MKLSFDQVRDLVTRAINDDEGEKVYCWIRNLYEDSVIYTVSKKEEWGGPGEALYERSYSLVDGEVTLGEKREVLEQTVYTPVAQFSIEGNPVSTKDGVTRRRGKIFQAGRYEDKGIEVQESDFAKAVEGFQPLQVNLEHARHPFLKSGLGELVAIEPKGSELYGEFAIPNWLEDNLKSEGISELPVSCEWHRGTKELVGIAICLEPRIEDAVVAAFVSQRHSAADLQMVQGIHDYAMSLGADCNIPKTKLSKSGRAGTEGGQVSGAGAGAGEIGFSGKRHSAADLDELQKIHDLAVSQGAQCTSAKFAAKSGGTPRMSIKDKLKAFFSKAIDEADDLEDATTTVTPPNKSPDSNAAEFAKTQAEAEQAKKERDEALKLLRARDSSDVDKAAAAFADEAISKNKALPSEKDSLIAMFAQAVRDDNSGAACFSDDGKLKEGERVASIRKLIDSRPAHNLTTEQIESVKESGDLTVVFNKTGEDGKKVEDKRVTELLAKSTLGRAIASNGKGGK